jgi:hypothetical protein
MKRVLFLLLVPVMMVAAFRMMARPAPAKK